MVSIVIRIKPTIGEKLIISTQWFESNQFFSQYLELKPAKVYEIVEMAEESGEWGISALKDVETEIVYNIADYEPLSDYFCFLDAYDNFRIVSIT